MDTIADSPRAADACTNIPAEVLIPEVAPEFGNYGGLEPNDPLQIEAALLSFEPSNRKQKPDWIVAFACATLLHLFLLVTAVELYSRFTVRAQWQVQRGDPAAEGGAPTAGASDRAADVIDESVALPSLPAAKTGADAPASKAPASKLPASNVQGSPDDASALPDHLTPPLPEPVDPVIGIGPAQSLQPKPRFVSRKPNIAVARAGVARGPSGGPAQAEEAASPPRVATSRGGQRGDRDGFDSRGLAIPDYPAESIRRREEGVVLLDVEVLPDGRVGTIRIVSDAGYARLGAAAVDKVKWAAFEPAREEGRAVVGHILIPYRFTLE